MRPEAALDYKGSIAILRQSAALNEPSARQEFFTFLGTVARRCAWLFVARSMAVSLMGGMPAFLARSFHKRRWIS